MDKDAARAESAPNVHDETADEQMATQMAQRRPLAPLPDTTRQRAAAAEGRRVCAYCHQPGDHPTPAHCLRALER
jgi:hypothetical protein